MARSVLIVAEEIDLRARIACALKLSGYAVELAADRERALKLAADQKIAAAIIAPGSSLAGLAVARELRDRVPKLLLLAEQSEQMARFGQSLPEADAFLLKSASDEELIGRLAETVAGARRVGDDAAPLSTILCMDGHKLDVAARSLFDPEGRELRLTRSEYALLKELAGSPGQVLSRDRLRHAIAGRGADPCERSIDMLVARLRQKVEPNPKSPQYLVTVLGAGYKLVARRPSGDCQPSRAEPSEPERRQLTVLSCGLVGAVALAASFDPEDLVSSMRTFQQSCTVAIGAMGGMVFTHSADEMLAVFGYPEAHEDDAERAVHAGLDLAAKVGQLLSPANQPLQMRIGIATGLVLVGQGQAVIGEPLGIAAGLRHLASPNSILVAESTRKLLRDVFICENLERYRLAGDSEAVNACRVTGRRMVDSRFKASRPHEIRRLVGRDRELQQLSALWDRAKCGEGQVALVCGEPGIGKSHLCEAFMAHIAEEPHATIRYQCSPHHCNSPFYPVINQLERAIRFEHTDTPENNITKIEAALSQAVKSTPKDISLYADLLSIAPAKLEPTPGPTPKRSKHLIIAALTRHLLDIASQQPLIIVLADAHWIDSSTLELIDRIIQSIKSTRILIIIKFRPEFCPQWLGKSHVTMLRLDRLQREETCAIISDLTGGKELPSEVHEQIIRKTDGIPLYVEELTKTVLESELVEDLGDRYVAPVLLPPLAIPATLLESLSARLVQLGPARRIAQIGAAIGREFSYRLLAAVALETANSLQAALTQVVTSELISVCGEPPDTTYTFKHALVQDSAYSMLSRRMRQPLHGRIADALEKSFPHIIESQPELLAHHLEQAGLIERAINYLRKAGQRAIETSAHTEAIRHLTHALELLRLLPADTDNMGAVAWAMRQRAVSHPRSNVELELNVMLTQAMIAGRGYAASETKRVLSRTKMLINSSTNPSQKFAILYATWASHYVGAELDKQWPSAAELLAEAESRNDRAALCIAYRLLGTTCVTRGRFNSGLRHLQQAYALFGPEHDSRSQIHYGQDSGAAALCYLSWALWHLGYVDQASNIADKAMQRAEDLCHPHTLVYTLCHARGFMDIFSRRSENLQSCARVVASVSEEHGLWHWRNCGRILEGWDAVCRGDVEQGIELLRAGIAGWQKAGARLWMPIFHSMEAEAYAKAGRSDAALHAINSALAISEETGERWAIAEMLRLKACMLSAAGANADQLETLLSRSLTAARRQRARCWELRASCDLARLWEGQGRVKDAIQLLQSIYARFSEGFDTMDLRQAKGLMESMLSAKRSGAVMYSAFECGRLTLPEVMHRSVQAYPEPRT